MAPALSPQEGSRQSGLAPEAVQLEGISELVFLDRYAVKDPQKDLQLGDTVVVLVKEDPRFPQKEVGFVRAIDGDQVTVELKATGELFTQERKKIDRPVETHPAQMWDRMARAIVEVEEPARREALQAEFRWLLDSFRFSPGGRINTMLGTGQQLTAYNCYVIPLRANDPQVGADSRQAIVDTLGNMVEIMSRGGGVGINLSTLRPRLAFVSGVSGRSSGAVSWGGLFSFATGLVEQGGSRRGALMLILEDWHPDLLDFIKVKRDMRQITNANISVAISHAFMKAVEEDREWELIFPDTQDPDYDRLWDGNIRRWRDEYGKPVRVYQRLRARDIWNTIIESAWLSAEPGVVFLERMNEMSNSYYFEDLISTNPCVTGDTLIYTEEGLQRADALCLRGQGLRVVIDGRQSDQSQLPASPVFCTGVKPVYRLTTREGYQLRLTADHKVMTHRGWVAARDLQRGDRVHILNREGGFGKSGTYAEGCLLGWLVADGTLKADRAVLSFWGDERVLAPQFAALANAAVRPSLNQREYHIGVVEIPDRQEVRVSSARLQEIAQAYGLDQKKLQVPAAIFQGTREMQQGFLQALFTADGYVNKENGARYSIRLTSKSLEFLRDVQRLLLNFGIFSRLYTERKEAGLVELPDGHGGRKLYYAESVHELSISRDQMQLFAEKIGFLSEAKQAKLLSVLSSYVRGPYREKYVAHVESVVPDGVEPVYDLTQPETHSFCANGIVVHNCGEQPLPAWGVCNLGHLNLARFVRGPIGRAEVLWEDLRRATRLGVRFLDNVIDITPYFFPENERVQKSERRIGMGTLGLGEMLIRLGLRYGSPESLKFIDQLYEFIAVEAYLASVELAREKGPFPKFDGEKFVQSGFMRSMPEHVREAVRQHGIRNVCLLTQAPTGSTGTMIGTSTGIEPYFSWTYWRNSRLGMKEVRERIVDEYFEQQGVPPEERDLKKLPDYFVTAMQLTPREHILVQATIQRWTDASISKTANTPNSYTIEQTRELYEYAYRLGCKGVTTYRDGSRDQQVLIAKEEEKKAPDVPAPVAPAAEAAAAGEGAPGVLDGAAHRNGTSALPVSDGGQGQTAGAQRAGRAGSLPRKRPQRLTGATYEWPTPLGKAFITINEYQGEPYELFVNIGKAGSDVAAASEALGRLTTLFLRYGEGTAEEKIGLLVKHLSHIGGSTSVGFGENRVTSVPDAIAKTLTRYWEESRNRTLTVRHEGFDLCPACGIAALAREEGCFVCKSCGYTKC